MLYNCIDLTLINMKKFKIRFSLKSHIATMETVINANNATEARRMIESQYGSDIRIISTVSEIK